jgi:hypothetical protein
MDPRHEQLCKIAYRLWEERGCPEGSPEIDWRHAEEEFAEEESPGQTRDGAEPSGYSVHAGQEPTKPRVGRGAKP